MSTQEQITAYQEVRKTLVERLRRLEIAPALVDDMSVFQLMNLLWLMAGHVSYLGVTAVRLKVEQNQLVRIID